MTGDQDNVPQTGSPVKSGAIASGSRLIDFVAKFVFALPTPERRRRAEGFVRPGDLDRARRAVDTVDEALSALLAGDGGLFEHKLRCLVIQSLGRPVLLELAAYRIQRLTDCEIFRMHVAGSMLRTRLAHDLGQFVGRYLPERAA